MRKIITGILLLIFCSVIALQAVAQQCPGSLGDPVIDVDFGSGSNPGPPSPYPSMQYTTNNCPDDGYYTIANSLTGTGNCHPNTWYDVPHDHTGNPNGYMMIINASYEPSVFFTQTVNGLCPNTTYVFSFYVLNLCIPSLITASYTQPDIIYTVTNTSGQQLQQQEFKVPVTPYSQGPLWLPAPDLTFTTGNDVSGLRLTMYNNAPGGNGNDFILDDITFRACGPIINPSFAGLAGSTQNLCQGQSANYTLTANVQAVSPVYQWQSNVDSAGWKDMPGQTTNTLNVPFTNATPGTYQYRLGINNGSAITDAACRVYSSTLTVDVNPLPVVSIAGPTTVCEGYPLQLTASGGASYVWTGPGIGSSTDNPLIINAVTPANAGAYSVVATTAAGCASPAAVQTTINVIPKVAATVADASIQVCAGESANLSASGGLYYKWVPSTGLNNDAIANPVATPAQTTTYTVHVSNDGCSDSSKTVTVTVNQNPIASAGSNFALFEGQSAKLDGTVKGDNITSFSWSPATFLDNPNSLTPTTTPTDNITYTLTAVSSTCGISTSSVFVRVYKKIIVPNTFSPNNDGVNDYWDIANLNTYPTSQLQVFNRYGQVVYESEGYDKPWDGTIGGAPLPQGTYYYIIDLKNQTPKVSGWVLIVR